MTMNKSNLLRLSWLRKSEPPYNIPVTSTEQLPANKGWVKGCNKTKELERPTRVFDSAVLGWQTMLMIQSLAFRRAIICEVYYCTAVLYSTELYNSALSTGRDHYCRLQQLLQLQTNRTGYSDKHPWVTGFYCCFSLFFLSFTCRDIAFQKNENDVIPEYSTVL